MTTPTRRLELVAIDDLVDDPSNPKGHAEAEIDASIDTLGYIEPIVEDERTGRLISGHGRKGALTRRRDAGLAPPEGVEVVDGVWHAWVVRGWSSADDAHAKAALVALNNIGPKGGWVPEKVSTLLDDLDGRPDLMALMSWDKRELDTLLARAHRDREAAKDPDDDDLDPDPELDPISVAGDVWHLGPHRLLVGSCAEAEAHATVLEGRTADLVFTDPPYGMSYVGISKTRRAIANDSLTPEDLQAFLRTTLGHALTHTRPGASWFVCAPPGPLQVQFGIVLGEFEVYRQTIIWVKDSLVPGHADYHHRCEFLFYGWAPGANHRGPPTRDQNNVWEFKRPRRSIEHPTMKPIELVERAITNHTDIGDVIHDPFGGSGTTVLAAERTRRVATTIELDPLYADVICRRYQALTGTLPTRNGEPVDFTPPT